VTSLCSGRAKRVRTRVFGSNSSKSRGKLKLASPGVGPATTCTAVRAGTRGAGLRVQPTDFALLSGDVRIGTAFGSVKDAPGGADPIGVRSLTPLLALVLLRAASAGRP